MRHLARTAPALVRACHPQPTLAVTAVATGLAVTSGRATGELIVVAAAILAGQLSVGWLNDLVDAGRDAVVGRAGKPVATGQLSRTAVLVGVLVAAACAVLLSLPSGWPATVAHLAALVSAWSYDLGVKAGALSVLPYAVSFGLLPAFVVLGLPGTPLPPLWLLTAAALLGAGAHFANVLPDLDDDLATGVRGLPHRMGPTGSRIAAAGLALSASVVLVLGPSGGMSGWGLLVLLTAASAIAVGLILALRPGSRSVFQAFLLVAVIDVALLVTGGVNLR
ncbi:4-hydroxybenzoate polyprenyltransferase [Halopolyspora algeriensis]|uniref:4-hydroxybenzoate polyprenyltransferase n=1 Tax=Halopolyspora algeriensis TaxID=1500506 RepID=A0A368VWT2_9ACTN|nr:UbiA family prenyltransferase [Halopolyspora algeriensis]RCW46309.1 4-hydroxybenzoate polyprenyltransferase [Halopolyspora algeriensis]TQM55709.1 4-hydroxybenzoate polyprenyltransferase [Halopolyspora algeriensis]